MILFYFIWTACPYKQASQIFGAEHLDPEKYSIDWRKQHVHLIPHMRGVMMVREMKTMMRLAMLRGVVHFGGFRGRERRQIAETAPETELASEEQTELVTAAA